MFQILDISGRCVLGCWLALAMLVPLDAAHAAFRVLHAFTGGNDGVQPVSGLVRDGAGNLYGTTQKGGGPAGYGTVFKVAPDDIETVLYSFCQLLYCADGAFPSSSLMKDQAGNLYGTTVDGYGTIFKLAPDGTETVLHSFTGGSDGRGPRSSLIMDKAGNLYGTTVYGGGTGCLDNFGCGTVYELAPDGTETVLYSFTGYPNDGEYPYGGLIRDKSGNLYGTTWEGGTGCSGYGCGIVFKLAPGGAETVLYAFTGGSDGANPSADLIVDSAGNFYGTTFDGGGTGCNGIGCGTIFKLTPDGAETVLYSFTGGSDGSDPGAGVIKDSVDNLYGTTEFGGAYGAGTVFSLAPNGSETVLHSFTGGSDGAFPLAGVIMDKKGRLYGTTTNGGVKSYPNGYGTVFRIKE